MEAEVCSEVAEGAIKERILGAIRARVRDFREQADSITLENVRRIIEKDLGMVAFTLDVHKRFIKQSLEKCLDAAEDETLSEDSTENLSMQTEIQKPFPKSSGHEQASEQKDHASLHENDSETDGSHDVKTKIDLNETTITRAIKKRASHLRANSETLSLVEVRRILEGDLELEKNALDSYKKFISKQLDEVLQAPETVKKTVTVATKRSAKGTPPRPKAKASEDMSASDASRSEDEEIDEPKERSRKRGSKNVRRDEVSKKQKKSLRSRKPSAPGRQDNSSEADEDTEPRSSDEETVKRKKETPPQAYGKQVEHLKSIIKSCGLGVPPSVYKRVKQAPESKRESYLIKELEHILSKEGLSTNPSEKEIKAVRKKKEKAKELEGIDVSNIVSSSRRRSTSSFVAPPKPEFPIESDEGEEEEEEDEEEVEEEEGEENEERDEEGNEDEDGEDDEENSDSEEEAEDEEKESV